MHTITLIPGDGIGPEVTTTAVRVVEATGVPVRWERMEAGGEVMTRDLGGTAATTEITDAIIAAL